MTPPPRRGSGKGRGRGIRGDRSITTSVSDTEGSKGMPKRRERGSSGSKRGGGGGLSASSTPIVATTRPTRAVTTVLKKVLVRYVQPDVSEMQVRELLKVYGVDEELIWRFVPGCKRNKNRPPTPSRVYVDMKKTPESARKLIASLHGQLFHPETKDQRDVKPLEVEFAPFQKIPREKQRKDAKVGTIDRDPEFAAFLEQLATVKDTSPSAEALADLAEGEATEKPVAALVKYLNERKAHSRDKGKGKSGIKQLDKSGRRQKGKKDGTKQKVPKEKLKSSKDRPKKQSGNVGISQDPKSRKQRGKVASNRESTKSEVSTAKPSQPILRIMTLKPAPVSSSPIQISNGTTPPGSTQTDCKFETRVIKAGKKSGGRGRNNFKTAKDGTEAADGEGTKKTDPKLHVRRKGLSSGKRELIDKGERKKKVFTLKDSTAQGAPAKI